MAVMFAQAHIWADEKTGRTSRMNANEKDTSILVTNLFIESREQMSLDNGGTVWRHLTLNLGDKKAVKLAVKIRPKHIRSFYYCVRYGYPFIINKTLHA